MGYRFQRYKNKHRTQRAIEEGEQHLRETQDSLAEAQSLPSPTKLWATMLGEIAVSGLTQALTELKEIQNKLVRRSR